MDRHTDTVAGLLTVAIWAGDPAREGDELNEDDIIATWQAFRERLQAVYASESQETEEA